MKVRDMQRGTQIECRQRTRDGLKIGVATITSVVRTAQRTEVTFALPGREQPRHVTFWNNEAEYSSI